jgi:HSP20 family protein
MRMMAPWTGEAGLSRFRREMDRLFERMLEPPGEDIFAFGEWAPSLDLSETKDALVVKLETPGIDPKDIHVSIEDQVLSVRGEKRQEKEERGKRFHRVECSYGAFARAVRLPAPVDAAKVAASYRNGVLTITLPKSAAAQETTVAIEVE